MIHDRVCPECGAAFSPRHGSQVCCSDACKRARKFKLDKESRALRKQNEPRICPECGVEFVPSHGRQICCSDKCKHERGNRQRRESKRRNYHLRRVRKITLQEQRLQVSLRRRDALAPKPKIEIINRDGIIIERRGNIPVGSRSADFIRHNA